MSCPLEILQYETQSCSVCPALEAPIVLPQSRLAVVRLKTSLGLPLKDPDYRP